MDDPSIASRVKAPQRIARRVCAFACSLLVALLPSAAAAGDRDTLRPLPPISETRPDAVIPSAEPSSTRAALGVTYPEQIEFYNRTQPAAGRQNFQLLSQQEPARAFTPNNRPFQLAVSQEPPPPEDDPSTNPFDDKPAADEKKPAEAQGEQQKFGREPVSNAMQFLRTQDTLLKPGSWQFDTGFAYTQFDNDFPVGITSGGPNLTDVVEGHLRQRLVYTPFALRYGWSTNVQLFGVLPVGFSNNQISTIGVSDAHNSGGLGDLTAGATLHLIESCDDRPDILATLAMTLPTGNFNAPVASVVPGSALGQGFWAISAQLLCINRYDPIIVYYGVGYRHLYERTFNGALFAPGEQISYQMGVGFAVNDRVTLSTTFQGFYISDILIDRSDFPGTNVEPMSLRFAATIVRRDRIIEPFALIGMTDFAPNASLGITVTFY